MISADFHDACTRILSQNAPFSPLISLLEKIAAHYESSTEFIVGHAHGGEKLNQASAKLQQTFTSFHTVLYGSSPSKVIKAADAFKKAIENEFSHTLFEHPWTTSIISKIDSFTHLYDKFLSHQSSENGARLIIESTNLNNLLKDFFSSLSFYNYATELTHPSKIESKTLSFFADSGTNLSEFIQRLSALQELYSELCMIASISETDHPLQVIKIESGSLWVKVFGEPRLINAMIHLLSSTIGYLHRNYTNEGKIASVPKKLESLDSVINLSEELRSIGVDTTEMDEHLRKSGVVIAKNLAILLEGQSSVRINGLNHSVQSNAESLHITRTTVRRLAHDDGNRSPLDSTYPHDSQKNG